MNTKTFYILTLTGTLSVSAAASLAFAGDRDTQRSTPPVKNPILMTTLPGGDRVNTVTKAADGYEFTEWKLQPNGSWDVQMRTKFDKSFSVRQPVPAKVDGEIVHVEWAREEDGAWKPVLRSDGQLLTDSDFVREEAVAPSPDRRFALEKVDSETAGTEGRQFVREEVERPNPPAINEELTNALRQAALEDDSLSVDIHRFGVSEYGGKRMLWGIVGSEREKQALEKHLREVSNGRDTESRLLVTGF